MSKGIRSLLETVLQALPQVANLGMLFLLLFFIYAALGVELFGTLSKFENCANVKQDLCKPFLNIDQVSLSKSFLI